MDSLRAQRDAFRKQVEEMTQFLADYGMTWVGDEDEEVNESETGECDDVEECAASQDDSPDKMRPRARSGSIAEKLARPCAPEALALDLKVVESQVKSLNAMVEKESARIVSNRVGGAVHARLVADDVMPLPLTFFEDGIKLGSHDLVLYESASAQQLIRDIIDGYFPFALKDEHPDGVAMKVIDRRSQIFSAWLASQSHTDPDLTDAGNRLLPGGGRRLGAARLGTRLPEKVVRDGRICEVGGPQLRQLDTEAAEALRQHFAAVGSSSRGMSAPVGDRGGEEICLLLADREDSAPAARLQVKLECGERVVLHMEPFQCIGELEDALAHWRAQRGLLDDGDHSRRFQLRTAFPRKVYSTRSQTLEEAGLTPSASLFVGVETNEV